MSYIDPRSCEVYSNGRYWPLRIVVQQTAKRRYKLLITSTSIAALKLELSIGSSKNWCQDLFQRQKIEKVSFIMVYIFFLFAGYITKSNKTHGFSFVCHSFTTGHDIDSS